MKISAGILMFRKRAGALEVLLVHPGGPFWKNKDAGAWSIPKGEVAEGEEAATAALREFEEELGAVAEGSLTELPRVKQKAGKTVQAWACEGDLDAGAIRSNTFEMEWPPGSGKRSRFPEVDRAAWFGIGEARQKINPGQVPLLEELEKREGRRK